MSIPEFVYSGVYRSKVENVTLCAGKKETSFACIVKRVTK